MHNIEPRNAEILTWLAVIGAGAAEHVATACGLSVATASVRLRALERRGLTRRARLLHGAPALHVPTRAGLRAAGRAEIDSPSIAAGGFAHQLEVGRIAAALGAVHSAIGGERELRALERAAGRPLASAKVGYAADGSPALHRPDLVCWDGPLPVAIEVELTVKAPDRLRRIVRGWARSRRVGAVVYFAPAPVARAVGVAVRREQAEERVIVLAPEEAGTTALPGAPPRGSAPADEFRPKRAVASPSALRHPDSKETSRWQRSTASS